jgi:hypothetical protein
MTKTCTKCGIEKSIEEFHTRTGGHRRSECKKCSYVDNRRWYNNNRERAIEYQRKWNLEHKDVLKESSARSYEKNKEKVNARAKQWAKEHIERIRASVRRRKQENPEAWREYSRRGTRKRYATTKGKLSHNLSRGIALSLNGNKSGRHWEDLVGFTLSELKTHLEKHFLPGMTWENYGSWHIDHQIPIAAFNFSSPEHFDFKKCWSLKNLRPLWAKDNIIKKDRLDKPFQPSLLLQ